MRKIWKTKEHKAISQDIINEAGSEILAKILVNRGIDSVSKIKSFLNPLNMSITSPMVFSDMKKSVERIKKAVLNNENITIYGDFDADGITSTAVLYKTLKEIGANVHFYLPNRESESHGLNTKALINIISKQKSKLIITVDCGISNVQEVNFANGFKTDIIITDHHEAPEVLPKAFAIINPKAKNSLIDDLTVEELENLSYLAGVGVAFKLSCALLEEFNNQNFVDELLPLVAVGTIADIVPLLGENRAFVQMGLILIQKERHKGLSRLLKSASVENPKTITSETIAFSVAPRLNAAGRLDSAVKALNVLIADESKNIDEDIELLNELNLERQSLCDETYSEAVSLIDKSSEGNKDAIILFNEEWHIGIIGIVASRLIEKYNKPVFMMTKDSPQSTEIRCSCRSIKGINVYEVLALHSDLFLGFGGHSMAAGFSFDEKTVSFDNFKKLLNSTISDVSQSLNLIPTVEIDLELVPEDVNYSLIKEIEKLQPFGAKNQPPVFALKNLVLSQYKMMGQNSNHLKIYVTGSNSQVFECVKWNHPDFKLPLNSSLDIAFYPKINVFNGNSTIQLDLKDIQSENFVSNAKSLKILDHRNKTDILGQVIDYIGTSKKRIALFVENKKTEEILSGYSLIKDKIFDRLSIPKNIEQVMFFDCPSGKDLFDKIVSLTKANTVHFMNFEPIIMPTEDCIKLFLGMLKFAYKNKNGLINIEEIAKATHTTNRAVEIALEIFSNLKVIELEKLEENNYKIDFKTPIELVKIKQNALYALLDEELSSVRKFIKTVNSADFDELKETLA